MLIDCDTYTPPTQRGSEYKKRTYNMSYDVTNLSILMLNTQITLHVTELEPSDSRSRVPHLNQCTV